ncbi:MAG TPA: MBL fold metallo-hydrolase, partial [Nonomuraea sp.]|nr:MBL fold metallo-hydrolase [Nonomuraea sp.]
MTYTGDVQVGGPADVRELPALTICKLAVGPYDNNAYLLRCAESGEGLLIDAAAEADRLLALIADQPLRQIVTTHQHGDHWQALEQVAKVTGARLIAHPLDAPALPLPVAPAV